MQLTTLHSLIPEGIMTINNLYPQRQMTPVLPKILSERWGGRTGELLADKNEMAECS